MDANMRTAAFALGGLIFLNIDTPRSLQIAVQAGSPFMKEDAMFAHHPEAVSGCDNITQEPVHDMKRIGAAGFTGTLIEYYDLQIFTTAAALVFAHLFFPQLGKVAGTVASLGTVGVVFVARPLGSILFGHFGDRLGRKRTLVVTLMMMGLSTVLVGVLPTSAQIGILAPILLILLRVTQGFAVGGEYAGAALLIAENAPPGKRGFYSCFPNLGGAVANSIAGLTLLLTTLTMSEQTFRAWGWRLPFLFSTVLLAIGLYIRLRMEETPVFKQEMKLHGAARVPLLEAISKQPRNLILGCMVQVPAFATLYLVVTFVTHYGANELALGYTHVLWITVASGAILFLSVLFSAKLSDRIGRRRVFIIANALATMWVLALFPLLYSGSFTNYALVVVVSMIITGLVLGPVGAFMTELFHTRYRYTAVGLCYNLGGIIGGALPPMLAGPIIAAYGTLAFGGALSVLFFVSFCCSIALKETRFLSLQSNNDIAR
jgi:MFS family permease